MKLDDQNNREFINVFAPRDIPEDTAPDDRIRAIYQLAWNYYSELAEVPVDQATLVIEQSGTFNAKVTKSKETSEVFAVIAKGCLNKLDELWADVMRLDPPRSGLASHAAPTAFEWANLSLFWLVLHEIGHLHFGHLALTKDGHLQEAYSDNETFGLLPSVTAQAKSSSLVDDHVFRCLELQADSVATECFLGVYAADMSGEDLIDLRFTATAAVAVMLAIHAEHPSRADAKAHSRHPSPGARIFILLGVIAQHAFRFLKRDYDDGEKKTLTTPAKDDMDEMDAYRDIVFAPLLAHLETVCRVLGGDGYFAEIGLGRELILDIPRWMLGGDFSNTVFESEAAAECTRLYAINLNLGQT